MNHRYLVLALALAFLFGGLIARAKADATITFALTGAGPNNVTKALVISDADGARFLNWAKAAYPTVIVPPTITDPTQCSASPRPAGCDPTIRAATNKESIDQAFQGLIDGLRANVQNLERAAASKSASDGVGPINPK